MNPDRKKEFEKQNEAEKREIDAILTQPPTESVCDHKWVSELGYPSICIRCGKRDTKFYGESAYANPTESGEMPDIDELDSSDNIRERQAREIVGWERAADITRENVQLLESQLTTLKAENDRLRKVLSEVKCYCCGELAVRM